MKEILILTDDISNYGKYRSLLEDANVEISHRSSELEALRLIREKVIDLVIIDLDVPIFKMKNLNVIKHFKYNTDVLNIVNDVSIKAIEECIKLGFELLRKPFKNESLLSHVNKTIFGGSENNTDNLITIDDCLDDSPFCDGDNYAEG